MIYWITLIGTFLFAISGVLAGIRKQLDLFGIVFISFVTALGGGTIRDVLTGNYPIGWVADINYAAVVLLAVLVTAVFRRRILKIRRLLVICDILGVGIFSILGLQKSLALGITPGAAIIFGVVSAIMGGVLRDILCNEIPIILRKEIYATACIAGGVVYVGLMYAGVPMNITFLISSSVIISIRILVIKYRLTLPRLVL